MGQHEHGRLNKPFRANGQCLGRMVSPWASMARHCYYRALNRFGRIVPGLGRPFGQRYAHVPIS